MNIPEYKESFDLYMFKENTLLKEYFKNKNQITDRVYTWYDIEQIFLGIISDQYMYDTWNTDIIICDSKLENILNVPYFHITQLKHFVLKHFTSFQNENSKTFLDIDKKPTFNFDIKLPLFRIKPQFYVLLSTLSDFQKKELYSFFDIFVLTSKYIISKKNSFFDTRNMYIVNVSKDRLGSIFNVNVFHRLQLFNLILEQLEK
jgi:hypothetical protein